MNSRIAAFFRCLSLALLCVVATSVRADPPARVGRVAFVSGAVSFSAAPEGDEWTGALANYPVTSGNRLWTDAGGHADVQVGPTTIHLDERTAVAFTRLDDEGVEVFVSQGAVIANLRATPRDQPVLVTTPLSQATLEGGGRFLVRASPGGDRADVTVRRASQAEIAAGSSVFSVYEDQTATVYYADELVYYDVAAAAAADAFEHWASARDRREPTAPALQFVSPATTGFEDLDAYGTWRQTPEYGTVWYPTIAVADWAPYRFGRWTWVAPWGWTWIDDAPWGFTPFHYGRWAFVGNAWAWVPGQVVARPVYAPALVAFVGRAPLGTAFGLSDHCGWVPLAPHENYVPWYRSSGAYVRGLNDAHAPAPTISFANRAAPGALTVVATRMFAQGRPVNAQVARPVRGDVLAPHLLTAAPPVAQPDPARFATAPSAHPPPPAVSSRLATGPVPPVRMRPPESSDAFRARPVREPRPEPEDRPGDAPRPMPPAAVPGGREPRGQDVHVPERRPPPQLAAPVRLPDPPAPGGPVDRRPGRIDAPRQSAPGVPEGQRDDAGRDVRRLGPPMVAPRVAPPNDRRMPPALPASLEADAHAGSTLQHEQRRAPPAEPAARTPAEPIPAAPGPATVRAAPGVPQGAAAQAPAAHNGPPPGASTQGGPAQGQRPPGQGTHDGGQPREHRQDAR